MINENFHTRSIRLRWYWLKSYVHSLIVKSIFIKSLIILYYIDLLKFVNKKKKKKRRKNVNIALHHACVGTRRLQSRYNIVKWRTFPCIKQVIKLLFKETSTLVYARATYSNNKPGIISFTMMEYRTRLVPFTFWTRRRYKTEEKKERL